MYFVKDHKTIDMFDRFAHLGPKRRALLDRTWAKLFREEVLPQLPVHLLIPHYDSGNGRPSNELYAMMGAIIIQQMLDLTDQQTVEQFSFNLQWHFALNITTSSDACSYVCERSIWEMRRIMSDHGLYQPIFESVSDHLRKLFQVDTSLQRLDSVHLFSNMRHLGRIRLFATTIRKFLTNLKRHHQTLYAELPLELTGRYLSKNSDSLFAMVKPSESSRTLEELGQDLFYLIERFAKQQKVTGMTSYRLLDRLLLEQCVVTEDRATKSRRVSVKPNREVPSDSLQNPSDPDATYDGHKGKGYQAQIVETYSEQTDDKPLSLITYIEVEAAHQSDAHAVEPYLDQAESRDVLPSHLLADSLYGSDDNCEKAGEHGVELVSPAIVPSTTGEISLTDFTLGRNGKVITCPAGCRPVKVKNKKERYSAVFTHEQCADCDLKASCPVKDGKRGRYLRYNRKEARLAQRRAFEKTEAFRNRYRFRAGVEGSISEFDRRTGVKQLRIRGMKAVRCSVFLKATGLNILRAAESSAYGRIKSKRQSNAKPVGCFCRKYVVVKEHVAVFFRHLGQIPNKFISNYLADDYQGLQMVT